jgi:hypothetical protein
MSIGLSFFGAEFVKTINNTVNGMFPRMDGEQKHHITEYTLRLLNFTAHVFNFDSSNKPIYERQFIQNKCRDLKAFILLLLPYIEDSSPNGDKLKEIKSLQHLVNAREDSDDGNRLNLESESQYKFSNFQYGRANRKTNTPQEYGLSQLRQNYLLLRETIQTVSHKLMVNWVDIIPCNKSVISELLLFIDRQMEFGMSHDDPYDEDIGEINKFWIGNIYETCSIDLYYNIKKVKWLLYTSQSKSASTTYLNATTYLKIVSELFPVDKLINNIRWNNFTDDEKQSMINDWDEIRQGAINNTGFKTANSQTLKEVLRSMVLFFNNYHEDLHNKEYKNIKIPKIKKKYDDDENDQDEIEFNLDYEYVADSIASWDVKLMIQFLYKDLKTFMSTWYGKKLIIQNPETKQYSLAPSMVIHIENTPLEINYKFIYNFCKSLVTEKFADKKKMSLIDTDEKNKIFGYRWKTLTNSAKKIIVERLKKTDDPTKIKWFNVSGLVKRYYSDIFTGDKDRIKKILLDQSYICYETVMQGIKHFVIECMVSKGGLSQFVPNPMYTDEINYPKNYFDLIKYKQQIIWNTVLSKESEYYGYHFMTNQKYSDMGPYYVKEKDESIKKLNFYEYIKYQATQDFWGGFYALNWISQISFFHRYLHTRITYVTGSTGVGKSTQIPKLIAYALKTLDHNETGRIVCTQPRIAPTTQNAQRISEELCVPIKGFDKDGRYVKYPNYSLQYQHSEKKHASYTEKISLKIVTDGLLLAELLKSPLLKTIDKKKEFTINNLYDVVIIDESHEHNPNMDLILSIIRYSLYYNNSIKLFIVSATMNDDEPTYRRFYRDINDNLIYPFNYGLKQHKLDCVNVDRRIHISPPGFTTKFKITEVYHPSVDYKNNTNDVFKKVVEIINTTITGDILVFQAGEIECVTMCERINKAIIGSRGVAIPYFSKMSESDRKIVGNINKTLPYLKIPDGMIFGIHHHQIEDHPVNYYNRAIIVATNIAEASITIDSLRFVVDSGTQKNFPYNPTTGSGVAQLAIISNSSREQRKGRVGRVAPGTVYFMYPKELTQNQKTYFNIAMSDISDIILSLMRLSETEELLIPLENDPIKSKLEFKSLKSIYKYGINRIIEEQYFINQQQINYVGSLTEYDYDYDGMNFQHQNCFYQTGLNPSTINDDMGMFYIVHPEEINIRRNIFGSIIKIEPPIKFIDDEIHSEKMISLWDKLDSYQLINKSFEITKLGEILKLLAQDLIKLNKLGTDLKMKISYLYGVAYNCHQQILDLFAIQQVTGGTINKLFKSTLSPTGGVIKNHIGPIRSFGVLGSDILSLLKMKQIMVTQLKPIYGNKDYKLSSSAYMERFVKDKEIYLTDKKNDARSRLDEKAYSLMVELDSDELLENNTKGSINELNAAINNNYRSLDLMRHIDKQKSAIYKWSQYYDVDGDIIYQIIKRCLQLKEIHDKIQIKLEDKSINFTNYAKEHLIKPTRDPLITCLLHGYGRDLGFRVSETPFYIILAQPQINNLYSIAKINPRLDVKDSLIKGIQEAQTILFLSSNSNTHSLNFVHHISLFQILKEIPHLITDETKTILRNNLNNAIKKIYENLLSVDDTDRQSLLSSGHVINRYVNSCRELVKLLE